MEVAYWLIGGLMALAIGSCLNVVISRLPLQLQQDEVAATLFYPASHCPQCKTPLRWRDNIPVLSWLWLRGQCRYCGCVVSMRYPLVEILTSLSALSLTCYLPFDKHLVPALLFIWSLLVLAWIDIEHFLLPDVITLPLLWAGLLFKTMGWLAGPLNEAVIGAVAGYLSLWLLAKIHQRLRGFEALGMGDAKLLAAMGAWLGWPLLPSVLLFASSGAILCVLISRMAWQREVNHVIAFGPWIALSAISLFIHSIIF
ncbi:MAG TPA: prepilin peptidase [Pantoea sp.]|nr:prepilin peptidase [Pantoea sp.]